MKRNDTVLSARIREALEPGHVPAAVDERLRQVYAELPDEIPGAGARHRAPLWLKRTCAGLAGAAAALLVLVGLNGVSPAFAESLPFIGGVFKTFNRGVVSNNLRDTQQGLNDYAVPAGENSVQVPAGGLGQKPITVSVDEVYYDGVFVYAGLIMDLEGCSDTVYSSDWGDCYNVLLNGEPQVHWDESTHEYAVAEGFAETTANSWWQKVESGKYISQRGFRVPEKYQDLDSLEVTLCCQGIEDGAAGPTYLANNAPFQLSFTVEKNSAPVGKVQGSLEMNGITFVSAEAGPAGSIFTFDVSGRYNNPARVISFEDGRSLGAAGAGKTSALPDGDERQTWFMGGVQPDETRRVVLGIMDKNDTGEWVAVFLIDFQNGTVEAGSPEDMKDPPYANYACGTEAVEGLSEGYLVSLFNWGEAKNSLHLLTPQGYQDLTVELWQDSRRLGSAQSAKEDFDGSGDTIYFEYVPQADGAWLEIRQEHVPLNRHAVHFYDGLPGFDPALPATVIVKDRASGETLLRQELRWNQPSYSDPNIIRAPAPADIDDITDESGQDAVSSQAE